MKQDKTLYVVNRDDWRAWLNKNYNRQKEVWLIYYKKHTGKPRIPYDDAVEEAICFGWIDSTVKRIDEQKYAQKFTPRNEKSNWSRLNRKRARKMIKAGKMTKVGLAKFKQAGQQENEETQDKPPQKRLVTPPDLKKALLANKKALENFNNFAPGYRRLYIGWITAAKRKETREKRVKETVRRSAQGKKPGMM
ncbi:MAG: YdeI/OmpD-associated family protein [Candidatus Zixiibacteriota bacterium]|nr:MAG: YdeI/OmpD-associated family protein [candidate division Zixibacteria bacterium]